MKSPGFKVATVRDAWTVARRHAEAYQKAMNRARDKGLTLQYEVCKVARDAADRIALEIRYGRKRKP